MKTTDVTPVRIAGDELFLMMETERLLIPVLQDRGERNRFSDIMTIPLEPGSPVRVTIDTAWSQTEMIAIARIVYRLLDHDIQPTGPRPLASPCVYCGKPAPNIFTPICKICVR